jgi:hypothetical protein
MCIKQDTTTKQVCLNNFWLLGFCIYVYLFQIVICLIGALWFCGYCVGNKVFYNLGPDLIIMVTNPSLVKEILLDVGNYHKARPSTFVLSALVGKSLLTMNGEEWANHRQVFAPAFRVEVFKVLSIPNH